MNIREPKYRLLILFFLILPPFLARGQEIPPDSSALFPTALPELYPMQQLVRDGLDTLRVKRYFTDKNTRHYLYGELADFYAARSYRLAWYSETGPQPAVHKLETALEKAPQEGLDFDYRLDTLRFLRQTLFGAQPVPPRQLARLDFLTTAAYLTYASHLLSGVADPGQFDKSWATAPRSRPLASHLETALQSGEIFESLQQLVPEHQQYQHLKEALSHYRALADGGGWPVLPSDTVLRKGDTSNVVRLLRERLRITGDLPESTTLPEAETLAAAGNKADAPTFGPTDGSFPAADPATILDEQVAAGLARYQIRNGLVADSILGPNTLQMLNVPAQRRVRQIVLNLERLRWWPQSFGHKYVLVNVPDYRLQVYEGTEKKLEMKVVVGKEYHSTPLFRDTIRYIVFSPTWRVPRSIAVREMLPRLKRDPSYLRRNHMKLYRGGRKINPYSVNWAKLSASNFPYRIVQQPGAHNALGRIKFMFPNKRAIYLHDTPGNHLFDRRKRAYSHGCVRVENPVDLAAYLLDGDPAWDRSRIRKNMYRRKPVTRHLPEPVPVQFLYRTAFVDEQGRVNFREDIYGHDRRQLKAVTRKSPVVSSVR